MTSGPLRTPASSGRTRTANGSHPNWNTPFRPPRPNAGDRLPHAADEAGAGPRSGGGEIHQPLWRFWARPPPDTTGSQESRGCSLRAASRGPLSAGGGLPEHRVAALRGVAVPLPGLPLLRHQVQDGARPHALRLLLPPSLRRRHQYALSFFSPSLSPVPLFRSTRRSESFILLLITL
jgi:hypothetical protein